MNDTRAGGMHGLILGARERHYNVFKTTASGTTRRSMEQQSSRRCGFSTQRASRARIRPRRGIEASAGGIEPQRIVEDLMLYQFGKDGEDAQ